MAIGIYKDPVDGEFKPLPAAPHTHDSRYVPLDGTVPMTGTLTTPDLVISGENPEPGLVWTAEDTLGGGAWQEPSSLVVAETSDPILVNWFDQNDEGWVQYTGTGTMVWQEMASPSMPGVLACEGDVWAEWQFGDPMVFEPGALYRVTVRARMDATAQLSFGFQGYTADTPAVAVDTNNGSTLVNPHWCAIGLLAGDGAWMETPPAPGEWLAWTGYLSERTDGVAENLPPTNTTAPADTAVRVALGVHQWRPAFHATGGKVWVDAYEVHRLDRSLELPGGIRVSDVYAESVNATEVTTENLTIPPGTPGYVLTAIDTEGRSEWVYPPITVTDEPPTEPPANPLTVNLGTLYGRCADSIYAVNGLATITSTSSAKVPGIASIQWTQVTAAMVSMQLVGYGVQSASSTQTLYMNIGVEDDSGTMLYTEDFGGGSTSFIAGGSRFKSSAGGTCEIPMTALYRRLLPAGTYLAYPRAWVAAVDAGSTKQVNVVLLHFSIDPGMTYLPGHGT